MPFQQSQQSPKKLAELACGIGATVLFPKEPGQFQGDIQHVYAGDRISDLLTHAHDRALLVTNLFGPPLIRLAELMDLSALCLVNGQMPDDFCHFSKKLIEAAGAHGIGILVSPVGMFETCGRLYQCFLEKQNGRRAP